MANNQHNAAQDAMQQWARSDDGKKVLEQAFATARTNANAFCEQIRIDVDLLRLPVSV